MLARVRRDLIDDSEAPTSAEIAEYPEVKVVLRKMEKDASERVATEQASKPRFG